MDDAEILHRLLFQALVEIRCEGMESRNKLVYHLADLFHQAVLELGRAARGELEYSEILKSLRQRAVEKGCERWLNDKVTKLEEKAGESNFPNCFRTDRQEDRG